MSAVITAAPRELCHLCAGADRAGSGTALGQTTDKWHLVEHIREPGRLVPARTNPKVGRRDPAQTGSREGQKKGLRGLR